MAFVASLLALPPVRLLAQAPDAACEFVLGFKRLHDAIPAEVGDCIDVQAFDAAGNAVQHTSQGLLIWRKADNRVTFTDGFFTWVDGPNGVRRRLNTECFTFEPCQGATLVPDNPTPTPVPWRPPPLTLDRIFKAPPDLQGADPVDLRALTVTGDIIPARSVNATVLQRGDFLYPYRPTADYLHSGDLLFVNLEAPLLTDCPTTREGMTFCGDARHIQGLVYAGVSVAGLANNHAGNYGQRGLEETARLLTQHGIAVVGLGQPAVRAVRGLRFAFLAFNAVGATVDRPEASREIAAARQQADVVVVLFHWGKEYVSVPQRAPGVAPDDPRDLGHLAVEAGADLVLGNHPHWVQGVEVYHERLIAYAHGNFIFDQMWSRETREGVVGRYTFYGKDLVAAEYRPVLIEDYAQPHFLEGDDAARVLGRMERSSRQLAQN